MDFLLWVIKICGTSFIQILNLMLLTTPSSTGPLADSAFHTLSLSISYSLALCLYSLVTRLPVVGDTYLICRNRPCRLHWSDCAAQTSYLADLTYLTYTLWLGNFSKPPNGKIPAPVSRIQLSPRRTKWTSWFVTESWNMQTWLCTFNSVTPSTSWISLLAVLILILEG